jgi:hypothetical protein
LETADRFTAAPAALAAVTVRAIFTVTVRLPDLPMTLTVDAPVEAVAEAVSVRIALDGVDPELNDPTTPLGRPERVTVTELLKPFSGVKVSVVFPEVPCGTLTAGGVADKLKVGGRTTVSAMVALLVNDPDVPVMVTVALAAAALLAAVKVTVRAPATVGPKAAVTPAGRPEAIRTTDPLKPFKAPMAMLLAPVAPAFTLTLAGVAPIVKLGGAATVILILVSVAAVPEAPITVTLAAPSAAFAAAVNVNVVVCVVEAGLNAAVTPVGRPVTENATVPLNPLCAATVSVLDALLPWTKLRLAGEGAIV